MILVVDIGNSRIKWACVAERGLREPTEIAHGHAPGAALRSMAEALPGRIGRVVAANVAGDDFGSAFTQFAEQRWDVTPEFVLPATEAHGLRCGYADPSRLGADRWVALVAAYRLAGGAACVIDAGTAVTLDAVDARGLHLGGLILAGPGIITTALDRQTSGIGETRGRPEPGRGIEVLGASTDEAVAKGAMLSLAGALDRALSAVAAELQVHPEVYLTGGDAAQLAIWLEAETEFRQYLVLEGLAAISGELDLWAERPPRSSG